LHPAALKKRQKRELQHIHRLRDEVTTISNRRNNLPSANPLIVPSYNPLLFSDIKMARKHRPNRPDCFLARVCPKSYKILDVEYTPGSGRFVPETEFDHLHYEDKYAGRAPWPLVPEELRHPVNLPVDKYWPKATLPPLQLSFQTRPLQHSCDIPNYVTTNFYQGPSGASATPPDELLDIRPTKRIRTISQLPGGQSSTTVNDVPSRFVVETDSPFRLQASALSKTSSPRTRKRDPAPTNRFTVPYPDSDEPDSDEEADKIVDLWRQRRRAHYDAIPARRLRNIMATRGMGNIRFGTRKAQFVDALVRDDEERNKRGDDEELGNE
jgi:hypothetical protein